MAKRLSELGMVLIFVGLAAMIGATILVIYELWFGIRQEPNLALRVFETGLACLGITTGWHLIYRELKTLKNLMRREG